MIDKVVDSVRGEPCSQRDHACSDHVSQNMTPGAGSREIPACSMESEKRCDDKDFGE